MSLDKSFEIQSGDQDKLNFALQGKRIYQYTTCQCATMGSFCCTKLYSGMVSLLFQNIIQMF